MVLLKCSGMDFNQFLWLINGKVINKHSDGNHTTDIRDGVPYHLFPISTKVYIEKFEKVFFEYKLLQEFIDWSSGHCNPDAFKEKNGNGLYLEAFCNGLSTVLQQFHHKFLAVEESLLSESSISILEILDKFQYMINVLPSLIGAVKELKNKRYHSCTILDLCENLIMSGSEVTKDVFRKIQQHCLKQFYKQTKLWVMQAVLYDPHDEFFICSIEVNKETVSSNDSKLTSVSTVMTSIPGMPKYNVNTNNLPNMIPLSVAMKMLFIGEAFLICQHNDIKSKNTDEILSVCGISEDSIDSQFTSIEESENFNLKDFNCLIDDLWIGVNKYIRQISDEIGNVREQLILMREIYLLGRGELFQEFLVKGSTILTSDVTSVDSRNLNKVFKDAVYNVYLTESSELTEQFFFKVKDKRALMHGSTTTWSQMSLKCKIKWPLHYLFTPDIIDRYNELFCFLLRLKKAQIDTTAWKNISVIHNYSLRMELILVRMYLLSVVGNLQNYCFTNVIGNEMTILLESVKSTILFTDLQQALSLFLTNICNGFFLSDIEGTNASNFDETIITSEVTVYKCFKSIFSLCRSFAELDGKSDEYVFKKLTSIKSKLERTLKRLFHLLHTINKKVLCDSNSSAHLNSLMMCLDYNGYFKNKFHLDPTD